ncbi:MAG: hypothetical protein ACOH2H_16275 [Cypionkella sp.]
MSDWFQSLPPDAGKTALAGGLGGLVRWITLREDWRDGLATIVVGVICALYLAPLVQPILQPILERAAPGGDTASFSGFIMGMGGISVSGFILTYIRLRLKDLRK